jgi:hypothetical protein
VRCEIDVFAYAFLKKAKNFDFFLPETREKTGPFRTLYSQWQREMADLEAFERRGKHTSRIDVNGYLLLAPLLIVWLGRNWGPVPGTRYHLSDGESLCDLHLRRAAF